MIVCVSKGVLYEVLVIGIALLERREHQLLDCYGHCYRQSDRLKVFAPHAKVCLHMYIAGTLYPCRSRDALLGLDVLWFEPKKFRPKSLPKLCLPNLQRIDTRFPTSKYQTRSYSPALRIYFAAVMSWRNQGITGSNNIPLGTRRRFGGEPDGIEIKHEDSRDDAHDGAFNGDRDLKRGRSPEPSKYRSFAQHSIQSSSSSWLLYALVLIMLRARNRSRWPSPSQEAQ